MDTILIDFTAIASPPQARDIIVWGPTFTDWQLQRHLSYLLTAIQTVLVYGVHLIC